MQRLLASLAASLFLLSASTNLAEDDVKIETMLEGLNNPSGVAIEPKTGHVFVSDSAALKIIRFDPATGKTEDCITGFPKDVYGKGPKYEIGPLGLAFTAEGTQLIVGGGGRPDGEELVYLFDVPAAGQKITAEDAKQTLGPIPVGKSTETGEGNFYAVAATKTAIFVTCNGDDKQGWVAQAKIGKEKEFGELKPFIATKQAIDVDAPVGICISPRGEVVVGQMGEISEAGDSRISFYTADKGRLLLDLPIELNDVCALAYSPKSPHLLYALDFSWIDTAKGGLFRLDAALANGRPSVNTLRLATLDKPTAMAFADDGTLYVTVFGTGEGDAPGGRLLKISGKKLDE